MSHICATQTCIFGRVPHKKFKKQCRTNMSSTSVTPECRSRVTLKSVQKNGRACVRAGGRAGGSLQTNAGKMQRHSSLPHAPSHSPTSVLPHSPKHSQKDPTTTSNFGIQTVRNPRGFRGVPSVKNYYGFLICVSTVGANALVRAESGQPS